MSKRISPRFVGSASVALLSVVLVPSHQSTAAVDASCTAASSPTTISGTGLDTATPGKTGVVYNSASSALELKGTGAVFRATQLGVSEQVVYACAADFDGDGWTDFVAAADNPDQFIKFYKNRTYENPAPNWNDANDVRSPKFVATTTIEETDSSDPSRGAMACGDFNNDGNQDFVYARCDEDYCRPDRTDIFLGNGDGTFQSEYEFIDEKKLSRLTWTGNVVVVDYNGDGWLDLIWGTGHHSGDASRMENRGGDVHLFLNNQGTSPTFTDAGRLIKDAGYNLRGPTALIYEDFTGDGVKDLIATGPSTNKMVLYPGLLGGGISTAATQTIPYVGGGTVMLAADFSLDGSPDFIVGTDNWNFPTTDGASSDGHLGGQAFYFKNEGDGEPFDRTSPQQLSNHQDPHSAGALFDFDAGFVLDYDHDPSNTTDFIILDGNQSANYFLFANRTGTSFVGCGTVASTTVDIGALASEEMTVSSVRISPSESIPNGTSITWEASNDNGITWHPALGCVDDANDYCVTFDTSTGNQIMWRATMCTDPTATISPTITSVDIDFAYVTAANHFRSGAIPRDGIVYVGAFREPGSSGAFFAIDDSTGTTLWEAGDLVQSLSPAQRNIYTVAADGTTRLDFQTSNASSANLQSALLAPSSTEASDIIDWATSARFGLTTGDTPQRVLGGIESSTPAVITEPRPPEWYAYDSTSASDRNDLDAFLSTWSTRPHLVIVGAKDGALHGFRTNAANPADPTNGSEAFAYIPYDVAQRYNADKTAGTATAYPDGSPTVADVKIGGNWRTVVVMGEGNGGRGMFALDITEGTQSGGTSSWNIKPLWHFHDPNMGRTRSKATIVRAKLRGNERWLAVFSSGPGNGIDVGDSVYAIDIENGSLVWRFDLNDTDAYIATSITAFETDDEVGVAIDGYIDRLVFADNKGRIWKLDPNNYTAGQANAIGAIDVGLSPRALFSTNDTPGALGAERAISGTMAAAEDASRRVVLYFGTGGTEDTPNNVQNAFYAVYADNGLIRSQLGSGDIAVGVKFYGGVVYNAGQLIFTTGQDLSGLGLCAPSAGEIVAIDANTFAQQFVVPTASKIVAPLYARNGQFYTVTLKGELVTSAYTGETNGTSKSNGSGGELGRAGEMTDAFSVLGWRQVY